MLTWSEILIRLLLASLFGALIGIERERKDWAAGMRTHMMVCVGSSLAMMVSAFGFSDILGADHVMLDPSRIAAQVISGIGFIGAGTILFQQGTIRGLTTAAGLWTVAAIGLATGGGMYFAAGVTTIEALIILWALQPLEKKFSEKFKQKTLRIITTSTADNTKLLQTLLEGNELKIENLTLDKTNEECIFQLKFENTDMTRINNVIEELKKEPTIKEIFWSQ